MVFPLLKNIANSSKLLQTRPQGTEPRVRPNLVPRVLPSLTPLLQARVFPNLVPRACDPWEGNEGSGIIRCRKPGILAKIELRIHINGQSDSSQKRIIPEPSFPSQGSQARGTRLGLSLRDFATDLGNN